APTGAASPAPRRTRNPWSRSLEARPKKPSAAPLGRRRTRLVGWQLGELFLLVRGKLQLRLLGGGGRAVVRLRGTRGRGGLANGWDGPRRRRGRGEERL